MGLGVLVVYLAFPTKDYYWDGIAFSGNIEEAQHFQPSLIHPNHLLYTAAGYFLYRSAQAVGLHPRAVRVLQISNSIVGAITAGLLFWLLQLAFDCAAVSVSLTLLFAFSASWWKFSTDADAYIISTLLLLACFGLLLPEEQSRPAWVAVTHSAAMLFHQIAIVFFPVVIAGIILQTKSSSKKATSAALLQYCVLVSAITFTAYSLGFYFVYKTSALAPLMRWTTTHSGDSAFSFALGRNLVDSLRGNAKLLLATAPHRANSDIFSLILLGILAALLLALAMNGFRFRQELRQRLHSLRSHWPMDQVGWLAALWIGCYLLFLLFWLPRDAYYRLFYLPAIFLLLGSWLAPLRNKPSWPQRGFPVLIVGAFALINFIFLILPLSRTENNPAVQFAEKLHRQWPGHPVVYYAEPSGTTADWTVRYLNPEIQRKKLDTSNLQALEAEIASAGPSGGVWLDVTAIAQFDSTPELRRWLAAHTRRKYQQLQGRFKMEYLELKVPEAARFRAKSCGI